ncbi:TPA: exosome complex protein Rrp42, partial [Candidatus Bathyarchaeota archaeon]|nr:exosome complex protein Rrp42 [Candidatus Bathyarchaeota archaeon]
MRNVSDVLTKLKKREIVKLLEEGKRVDGRSPDAYRSISIRAGVAENADGSAEVTLGETRVIAGVKIEAGEPFPDFPDAGALIVSAQFLPLASPTFKGGRPGEEAVILARIIDRALRSSQAIDLKQLCIEPGKRVFSVFIDVCALNHGGNLIDASMMAALAALMNTKVRDYEVKDGEIVYKSTYKPLPLRGFPLVVTVQKIGKHLVVDPCLDEEMGGDAYISIGIDENKHICTVQKSG